MLSRFVTVFLLRSQYLLTSWLKSPSTVILEPKKRKSVTASTFSPTRLKRPWCWERLKAGGEGDDRGWDDWMASLTQWTWVWVNSGSWRWTGRPDMLQSMGSQRVGHDWANELNWICCEVMEPDAMILVCWILSLKPAFSLSSFTFIRRLFSSSSLSAIRVVSSAYLRLLIFLPAILIPACDSSTPAFHTMYSACKLNKQGDSIHPCHTLFPILNQSVVSCLILTAISWPVYEFLLRWQQCWFLPSKLLMFPSKSWCSLICRCITVISASIFFFFFFFFFLIFSLLVCCCQALAGDVRLAALIFLIVNLVWTTEFRIKKVHNRSHLWGMAALSQSLSVCPKGCPWVGSNSLVYYWFLEICPSKIFFFFPNYFY